MMAIVAIVWESMRMPFMIMVSCCSWLLVGNWSSVVENRMAGDVRTEAKSGKRLFW